MIPDLSQFELNDDNNEKLPDLSKFEIKSQTDGDESVARIVDDELSKLGWAENARLSLLGDIGRENSWNRQTIFGGHIDPASYTNGRGKIENRGIISWNGSRKQNLDNFLQKEGVYGKADDDELRGMVRFMDSEMRDSPEWKGIHKAVRKPNISTYDASENLRKYIKYVPDGPYNSPDDRFRVKANRKWAERAEKLGLGKLPDLSAFEMNAELPDLSAFELPSNSEEKPLESNQIQNLTAQKTVLENDLRTAKPQDKKRIQQSLNLLNQSIAAENEQLKMNNQPQNQPMIGGAALALEDFGDLNQQINRSPEMRFFNEYNTPLSDSEEKEFQSWATSTFNNNVNQQLGNYDLRGAWKAIKAGDVKFSENGHLPDKYKKPNHPTFSNDSQYSRHDGGEWKENNKKWTFTPSKRTIDLYGVDGLKNYFNQYEKDAVLNLPSKDINDVQNNYKEFLQVSGLPDNQESIDEFNRLMKLSVDGANAQNSKDAAVYNRRLKAHQVNNSINQPQPTAKKPESSLASDTFEPAVSSANFRINLKKGDDVRRKLNKATIDYLSANYGIESQDAEKALKDFPVNLEEGGRATDTILQAEADRNGFIDHTVGKDVIERAWQYKQQRINQTEAKKRAILNYIASGRSLSDTDIAELRKEGISLGDIDQNEYTEAVEMGKAGKQRAQGLFADYKQSGDTDEIAMLKVRRDLGWITPETYQTQVNQEIDAQESLKKSVRDSNAVFENETGIFKKGADFQEINRQLDKMLDGESAIDYIDNQARIAKEYENRPLARPLEFAKNFYKAFPKAVSSLLQSASIAQNIAQKPLADAIDYIAGTDLNKTINADNGLGMKLGNYLDEAIKKAAPSNKDFSKEFFITTLPDTLGQLIVQTLAGIATGGATLPTVLGMTQGASSQYKDAAKFTNNQNLKLSAAVIGGLLASTDSLVFKGWFKTAGEAEKAGFFDALKQSIATRLYRAGIDVSEKEALEIAETSAQTFLQKIGKFVLESPVEGGKEGFQELTENKGNAAFAYLTYDKSDERRKAADLTSLTEDDVASVLGGFIGGVAGHSLAHHFEKGTLEEKLQAVDSFSAQIDKLVSAGKIDQSIAEKAKEKANQIAETQPIGDTVEHSKKAVNLKKDDLTGQTIINQKGLKGTVVNGKDKGLIVDWENGSRSLAYRNKIEIFEEKPDSAAKDDSAKSERIAPVPEKQETLDAQIEALEDKSLKPAAVLFTDGEDVPRLRKGFSKVNVREGILYINNEKADAVFADKGFGKFSAQKLEKLLESGKLSMTDMIGGKAVDFGDNTSGGTSLVSKDKDGNELVASKISDNSPENLNAEDLQNAEKQKNLDTERFGTDKIASQEITETEKVAADRNTESSSIVEQGNIQFKISESDGKYRIAAKDKTDADQSDFVPFGFQFERREDALDWIRKNNNQAENSATAAAHDAATSPANDLPEPTQAQKEAGNYQKGHISINGLNISVENPVGSKRSGTDRDGKKWEVEMNHHYGYIKGSIGADKEHIDIFVKDGTPKNYSGNVFVVDQIHPDNGKFDEHKVMLGYDSEAEARAAYLSNYAKDWKGLGKITAMPFEDFKAWTKNEQSNPVTLPSQTETKQKTDENVKNAVSQKELSQKNLSRNYRAGTNDATITFDSETQKDLYDLAAKEKYRMRGGQNKTSDRSVGDIESLKKKLIASGINSSDLTRLSQDVYEDVRAQMKGVKDLEERKVADNVTKSAPENSDKLNKPQESTQKSETKPRRRGLTFTPKVDENITENADEILQAARINNDEINLKNLYNKDGEIDYEQVKDVASRVISGTSKIVRLNEREERGRILGGRRNVEASIICGAETSADRAESRGNSQTKEDRIGAKRRVEAQLEKYAKNENIWFDYDEFVNSHTHLKDGEEARVFEDTDPRFVVKLANYSKFDEKYSPGEFIDERISLFNFIFPLTHYELVGFTRDSDNQFHFVLKQPYIDGKPATVQARVEFMKGLLGEDSERTVEQFSNREYHVSDLHDDNVLQDKNGNVFVIDAITELTPERLRGVRKYEDFRIRNNSSEFDSNEPSILKKSRDFATVSAIEEIEGADLGDLLDSAKPDDLVRDGYLLETASLPIYEIMRSAAEQVEMSRGNDEPFRNDAFYLNPSQVKAVVKALQKAAKDAVNAGISVTNAAKFEALANTIADAAKIDGSAIVYLFDDAIPHEEWHKTGYQESVDKKLAERHTPENLKKLANSDTVKKLRDGAFSMLYANASDALAVEEASSWLAGGGREKLNDLNRKLGVAEITEEEADNFLVDWVLSFKEKNPNANLDKFAKINDYAGKIIEKTNRVASENRSTNGTAETNRRNDGQGTNVEESSGTSPSERSETKDENGLKERQTIVSAEESGVVGKNAISGDARYYKVKSRDANVRAAQEIIEKDGLAQATVAAKMIPETVSAEFTAFQMEVVNLLNRQADEAVNAGDKAQAAAKLAEAQSIVTALAQKSTELGQAISQLAAWQKTDPNAVTGYVQKRRSQNDYQKPLSPEESKALRASATEVQHLNKQVADLQQRIDELEQKIADNKSGKKSRNPIEKKIAADLSKKSATAIERLKAKFGIEPILQMTAWHGSPHRFEKFDSSKIGTGEGNQSYGHGLYFAEAEEVADFYKDMLSRNSVQIKSEIKRIDELIAERENRIANEQKTLELIKKDGFLGAARQQDIDRLNAEIKSLRAKQDDLRTQGGAKYKVDLKPAESDYLLWDKPLNEQSEKVQNAFKKAAPLIDYKNITGSGIYQFEQDGIFYRYDNGKYVNRRTGEPVTQAEYENALRKHTTIEIKEGKGHQIYQNISNSFGDDAVASNYLKSLGIRGIKYLDSFSRGKDKGSYNYVIFDDADVEIEQILQMARPLSESRTSQLDADTLQDFSDIGADILMSGSKENPVTVADFRKQMIEIFGDDIRPHLTEIHALSVKNLKQIKSDAYRARAVETLQNVEGNEDLTIEDLNAIVESQLAKRRENAKIRGEHTREANKFFNEPIKLAKQEAKIIEREQKQEDAHADKIANFPSFAKSLFKVAATQNQEILVGALLLETGQVRNVDELVKKIRQTFPNISSREALNSASLAARARKLAHDDLKIEREKLRKEKTEAEKEATKIKTERAAAVRQLLNRISYLEKAPPSYSERMNRLYQSALVSAVQTSINNALTAQGTRKVVSATDLGEVLINKTLRAVAEKMGKELNWQYSDKLSAETRLLDILGVPQSEDYSIADMGKHFITDAIFARTIANSVLDESPMMYEALFGSFASDIGVMREQIGAKGAADWSIQQAEKVYEKVNFLNSFQEFLIRSQEFNHSLQLRLGMRGLDLTDVIKNGQISEKITEEDLQFAVTRALQTTFALKPDKNTNFGRLVNSYKDIVPGILSPFLITFPNYLYNATKFVSDYAPLIQTAKIGINYKKERAKGTSVKAALSESANPRVIAQHGVGWVLFLSALGLVRAVGDDDKWYYLRIPFTDGFGEKTATNPTGSAYIDVRGYQPFASFIFLANKLNRLIDGKYAFSDGHTAFTETMEALTGLSTRNIEQGKMFNALYYSIVGSDHFDGRDGERVWKLIYQQSGEILGGFLRPLKTMKDIVAQFDEYERKLPETTDAPFREGIARSLPFANRILQLEPKKDFVTGKESSQSAPILKVFGISVINPDQHRDIPSKALIVARTLVNRFEGERDILPDSQRKAQVKSSLYRALREAGDDTEKLAKVDEAIKRAEDSGILQKGELEFIERKKGMTELESLAKSAKRENVERIMKFATDSEKSILQPILDQKLEKEAKTKEKEQYEKLKDDVRSNKITFEKADEILSKRLDNGEISKQEYKNFLLDASITKVAEKLQNMDASSDSDFEKIDSFTQNIKDEKERAEAYSILVGKITSKIKSKDTKGFKEAQKLNKILEKNFADLTKK